MAGEYVVYAYFNQSQVVSVVNAITMLMNGSATDPSSYTALIRLAGMLGLFMAMIAGIAKARGESAGMYLVIMALFYTGLFVPKVTLTVRDAGATVYGGATADVNVDNVPIGLAVFASASSQIGHWFTQHIETTFALPDASLNFASNGLLGGARAMRMASTASAIDPDYRADVAEFMRWCINPEIVANPAAIRSLLGSTAIVADIGTLGLINPGRRVTMSDGIDYDCGYAYTEKIAKPLQAAAPDWLSRLGMNVNPGLSPSQASTMMTAMLPAAQGLAGFAAQTALESLSQRIMINALNDNNGNLAQAMNDPAGVQAAVGAAQAEQQSNLSYKVMAKIGTDALPVIRNSIHLVILGCFPFVLILVIIAGDKGGKVLSNYLMGLLWVELWAPLYAIVNYITTLQAAKSMAAAKGALAGIAVSNSSAIAEAGLSAEAISGLLCVSVPVIALALVKGGEVAAASMATSLMQPSSSAAQQAGAAVGMGNISAGNLGWGNSQINNHTANADTSRYTHSRGGSVMGPDGTISNISPSGAVTAVETPMHKGPLNLTNLDEAARNFTMKAAESRTRAKALLQVAQNSLTAASGETVARQELNARSNGLTTTGASVTSGSSTESGGRGVSSTSNAGNKIGSQDSVGANAGGNVGSPGGSRAPAGGKIGVDYSSQVKKAAEAGDISAMSNLYNELNSHVQGASHSRAASNSNVGTSAKSITNTAALTEAKQAIEAASQETRQAAQYEQATSAARSLASNVSYAQLQDAAKVGGGAYLTALTAFREAQTPEQFVAAAESLRSALGIGKVDQLRDANGKPLSMDSVGSEPKGVPSFDGAKLQVEGLFQKASAALGVLSGSVGAGSVDVRKLQGEVGQSLALYKSSAGENKEALNSLFQGSLQLALSRAGVSTLSETELKSHAPQINRVAKMIAADAHAKGEDVGVAIDRFARQYANSVKAVTKPKGFETTPLN